MALSHETKLYGIQDLKIFKLLADPTTPPTAPSAPSAPTVTPITSGAVTQSYTLILTNGVDSTASTAGTTATGATTPNNTVTFTAIPAGQVGIIQRTVGGTTQGVIATVAAGTTSIIDNNLPAKPYVANTSGVLYNPAVNIPAAKSIAVAGTVNNVQLRGDNQLLDSDSILQLIKVTCNHGKVSFDALAAQMGGTVTDSGTTPNQIAKYAHTTAAKFGYFKIEAQAVGADALNGDAHYVFYKCKIDSIPGLGLAEENYQGFQFSVSCMPRYADGAWFDLLENETAVTIV
jgi:hypothetical protein